jgi:hypothetical protein
VHLSENHISSTPDQKRELVQRVVKSQVFSRSPAMRAFLVYVAEHAIEGRAERLKEQTIGAEVLGRKPNYDPADDNIVRVRAHELRSRLEKYFTSEGTEEPILVTIPKGSYVPEFVPRAVAAANATIAPASPAPIRTAAEQPHLLRRYWLPLTAALLIAVFAPVALSRYGQKNRSSATAAPSGEIRDFWGQFFDHPDEELKIVYADTNFALWQDLSGKDLNLGDYLSHKYLQNPDDNFREVAMRRSTSPADLLISVRLASLAGGFGGRTNLQSARNADTEFFQHGNAVVIGSHRSNPWVEIFESNLNFAVEQDPRSGAPLFKNRSPQSRESSTYAIPEMLDTKGDEQREFRSYGLVALVKGCGGRGLDVVLEGLNMQATQAAGDMVTDPQRLDNLLRVIGHKAGTTVTPFEALFQLTSLPGGYANPEVIAFRIKAVEPCRVRQ